MVINIPTLQRFNVCMWNSDKLICSASNANARNQLHGMMHGGYCCNRKVHG
jgi:hypothetical protein